MTTASVSWEYGQAATEATSEDWDPFGRHPVRTSTPLLLWLSSGTAGSMGLPDDLALRCLGCLENDELLIDQGTSIGGGRLETPSPSTEALLDIRARSGLTWQQLARIFHVDRRSLHFWAKGSRPSGEHAERLELVRAIVRQVDAGDADVTRQKLLTPVRAGTSVLDLLETGRDQEALDAIPKIGGMEAARPRRRRRPPAISRKAREDRRAYSAVELVGALREDDHSSSPMTLLGVTKVPDFRER